MDEWIQETARLYHEGQPLTQAQRELLDKNPYLEPVERLSDGDWLILDIGPLGAEVEAEPSYILTRSGKVQGIAYHYRYYHGLEVPAGSPESPPSLDGPAHLDPVFRGV